MLVTDGVFSADGEGGAVFHPALDLGKADFAAVQAKMRRRGLRWLLRHGHLDDLAVHALDTPDHADGWSVDASVTVPGWDRHGLERLVRYCARPPLSGERLGRLNDDLLVYHLRKPTTDGRAELPLTPQELLDRLARLVTPPRRHKHRYCGSLAPNANLRQVVTTSAGPAGSTLQVLEEARRRMALPAAAADPDPSPDERRSALARAASQCWALLLVRIYECLPQPCPRCGQPMRIIAFVLDPPVIGHILRHIGEPVVAPLVLPARSPPQGELGFDHTAPGDPWPETDQTAGALDPARA